MILYTNTAYKTITCMFFRRQQNMELLPPLPYLPEINTPESNRSFTRVTTNDGSQSQDYFPSPSQVQVLVVLVDVKVFKGIYWVSQKHMILC